jgi:acyl carrier protein
MNTVDIEALLIKIIEQIQEMSGRAISLVTTSTVPHEALPDFDSLNGVEVTVELLDALKLETGFNNVFIDGDKALSVKEAAERLHNCIKPEHRK